MYTKVDVLFGDNEKWLPSSSLNIGLIRVLGVVISKPKEGGVNLFSKSGESCIHFRRRFVHNAGKTSQKRVPVFFLIEHI